MRPKGLPDDAHLIRAFYECECGESWESVWDCACDDECPSCGLTISASDEEDVDDCDCPRCEPAEPSAPPMYAVRLNFQSEHGNPCSRRFVVKARDMDAAYDLACAKLRRRLPRLIKIDGGDIDEVRA